MKITYISHSGFLVELENHVFLFDYYKSEIPQFSAEKKFIVFSSHVHHDHYVKEIFDWKEKYGKVHYVLSSDIRKSAKKLIVQKELENQVTFMRANEDMLIEDVKINTLRSTDAGVAFLVECEGLCIYHAGDLNWWHWEGEPEEYNEHMKDAYLKELEKIAGKKIDVGFVPVDPRLGEQYYYGIDAFAKKTEAKVLVPMHFWGDYSVCERLQKQEETKGYRDKICTINREGEEIWDKIL